MLVAMGQGAAQRVSALVTVQSASIPSGRPLLDQRRLTALRATLGGMEREGARRASVLATVRLAGTPLDQLLLAPRHLTALLAHMASTLGHLVVVLLLIARIVYLERQTWTMMPQQHARRARLDNSLLQVPLRVSHVQQVRLTWTAIRPRHAILVPVVASHHKDQSRARTAQVERQIPTPLPPLNA